MHNILTQYRGENLRFMKQELKVDPKLLILVLVEEFHEHPIRILFPYHNDRKWSAEKNANSPDRIVWCTWDVDPMIE